MISRKTIISLALVFVMVFSCFASYADTAGTSKESETAAEKLYIYGLFKGGANGFNLEGTTTKEEAAAMVVRLLGAEDDALSGAYKHSYKDVTGWSSNYIGYLYENGILGDTEDGLFAPKKNIDTMTFLKMILNALGYAEAADSNTSERIFGLAVNAGLLTEAEAKELKTEGFTRSTMVLIAYDALNTKISGDVYKRQGLGF